MASVDQVVQVTSWDALGTYLRCVKKTKRDLKSGQECMCFADGAAGQSERKLNLMLPPGITRLRE